MNTSTLDLTLQPPFNFRATAYSHGWVHLAPNTWDPEKERVGRVLRLGSGNIIHLSLEATGTQAQPGLRVEVSHRGEITRSETSEIQTAMSRMFRLDEDLEGFYALCRAKGEPWTRLTQGWGRLLRSPTLFEDVVKTICTTNIQWGGTKSMVHNLVMSLGDPFPGDPTLHTFPTPQAIAAADPSELAAARLGYRGPYIHKFAQQVVSGDLDLGQLEDPELSTEALRKRLLAIKGVGNYAAHTLLMLLGRYEHLAYDTAMRDFISRKYFSGKRPTEQEAQEIYSDWGDWKYLAYWFDNWDED